MCDKAYKKAHEKLTKEVKTLAHSPDDTAQFIQLQKYNSVVAGLHEYYCIATETTADFGKLAFSINKQLRNRLKGDVSRKGSLKNGFIKDKYGKSRQLRFLHERPLFQWEPFRRKMPKIKGKTSISTLSRDES